MNYANLPLAELKKLAAEKKIPNRSTMKKADLIAALSVKTEEKPSFIDALKASFAVNREARSNKGRKAGQDGTVTAPKLWQMKDLDYRLQRGSATARLTPKQERRIRKTQRQSGMQPV